MTVELNDINELMASAIADWVELTTVAIGGRVEEWNGIRMCDFKSTHPYRNAAVVTRPLEDIDGEELIERLEEFYQRDHGWCLISTFPLDVEDARLRYSLTEPTMLLDDPSSFKSPNFEGLTIVDVHDGDGVLQFERLHAELYARPHLQVANAKELWNDDVLNGSNHLFIGYIDGVPVATGGAWETEKINEITSLTTRPSYRGRGIARAMMRYAMDKSKKTPVLFSSVSAQQAYERMGFRVVGDVNYWVPPNFEAKYPGGWNG